MENLLSRIPEEEKIKRELALQAALFTKPFNQDDLVALPLLTQQDVPVLYDWLIDQPFVRQQGDLHYDEHVQALFCLYLKDRSPNDYDSVRKALVEHYQQQLQERVGQEAYSSMVG